MNQKAYFVVRAKPGEQLDVCKVAALQMTLEHGIESVVIWNDRLYSVTPESLLSAVKPADPAHYMPIVEAVEKKLNEMKRGEV